jgi:hypothetical protein
VVGTLLKVKFKYKRMKAGGHSLNRRGSWQHEIPKYCGNVSCVQLCKSYNFKRQMLEGGVRKRMLSRKPVLPKSSRNAVLLSTALSFRDGRGITVVNVTHNITVSLNVSQHR